MKREAAGSHPERNVTLARLTKLAPTAALTAALICAGAGTVWAATPGPSHSTSYWVVTSTGKVCSAGHAKHYGNGHGKIVAIDGTKDGRGYWLVLKSGKTQAFGDAKHDKYHKTKTVKWTRKLGSCKKHVVGAAVAHLPKATKTKPKPPTTPTTPAPVNPSITTQSIPQGEAGLAYSTTLSATGGAGGYVWTTSGSLPGGLSLSLSGTLSGTPTQSGPFTFTATVTTSDGGVATERYALSVLSAVSVTTTSLHQPEAQVAYSSSALSATGGAGSYTWALSSGQLPPGLTLDTGTGEILGTPTTAGAYTFSATATDTAGSSATRSVTLTVAAPVTISTSQLPDPAATLPYDVQLSAGAGSSPYTWSLASGSLPAGLSLTSSGQITGTPTASSTGSDLGLPTAGGSYTFSARVTDADGGTSTQSYTVLVSAYNNLAGQGQTWSGYAQVGQNNYTSDTGTFTVPTLWPITPPTGTYADGTTSEWVGIDGDGNQSLIQAGVDSSYTAHGDVVQPWTEVILPGQDTYTPLSTFAANPGDSVTVTVNQSDPSTNTWTIAMRDNTTSQTYQTSVSYTGPGQTAEWIVEATKDPSTGHVEATAPFYGTINFTNLGASQPAVGQQYMSFEESGGSFGGDGQELNSFVDTAGFAVSDDGTVPPPL